VLRGGGLGGSLRWGGEVCRLAACSFFDLVVGWGARVFVFVRM